MEEFVKISIEELNALKERANKLAREKSSLQLVVDMMNKLNILPDIDFTINTILQYFIESIGGSNVTIYYLIDNITYKSDLVNKHAGVECVTDEDVKKVFETGEILEITSGFENTMLNTGNFTKSYTWFLPLIWRNEKIGVLKIENLHIGICEFTSELSTFVNYISAVLKNEIAYTKLKMIYNDLSKEVEWRKKTENELLLKNEELKHSNEELYIAQKKEEASKNQISAILNALPDIIFIQDKEGVFIDYHLPKNEKLYAPANELLGKRVEDFVPELVQDFKPVFEKAITTGELQVFEYSLPMPNGIEYFEGRIITFENDKVLSICRNITESKKSAIALTNAEVRADESEVKHKFLFDNTIQGVVYHNSLSEIVYANKSAEKILGITIAQMQASKSINPLWRCIHEDGTDYPREIHPAKLTLKTGEPVYNVKMGVYNPILNNYRWLNINSIPQYKNNENEPFQVAVTFEDITEIREKTQNLIKSKEKAEESDRLKTAFLQNMSHEIRTPMNSIVGFSNFLKKKNLSEEKRENFTNIVINNSNQLLSIVEDILTISAIQTKQEKLNIEQVCINQLFIDLISIFKEQASKKNITLSTNRQLTDKESHIFTDKTKLTQILTNLMTNALKFTHDGFIEIGYLFVEMNGRDSKQEIQFYVKDTGLGIALEHQKNIFERFRQADLSISKNYGGTGLGLSISKGFVELLGGEIWVESELDKGSTFYFTIPFKPANQITTIIEKKSKSAGLATILVAEDEEFNFIYIEELLSNFNFKLIHSKDGIETVEICKNNPAIDLILMDIKMPLLDGFLAAKQIKKFRPDLPIIAQSAYALEHERQKYSGIEFDDYITKPMSEDELKQKVLKYLGK